MTEEKKDIERASKIDIFYNRDCVTAVMIKQDIVTTRRQERI